MRPPVITVEQFALFAPQSNYQKIAPALNKAALAFGIDTPREVRHWLAHLSVESAYFSRLTENLNYSAKRLTQVWPSRFKTLEAAKPYANNPEALANKVYGGRMGNVNQGDGFRYRGRGFIQLTGRDNYERIGEQLKFDLVKNPDVAATPEVAAVIAGQYWKNANMSEIVARDNDEKIFQEIKTSILKNEEDDLVQGTRAINGGLIGLDHRRIELIKAAYIWKDISIDDLT